VALLARRVQIGDQPLADRLVVWTEQRRRPGAGLARRRQRRTQRLTHRPPVHTVAAREAANRHALFSLISSDTLKQLHLRQLLVLRCG